MGFRSKKASSGVSYKASRNTRKRRQQTVQSDTGGTGSSDKKGDRVSGGGGDGGDSGCCRGEGGSSGGYDSGGGRGGDSNSNSSRGGSGSSSGRDGDELRNTVDSLLQLANYSALVERDCCGITQKLDYFVGCDLHQVSAECNLVKGVWRSSKCQRKFLELFILYDFLRQLMSCYVGVCSVLSFRNGGSCADPSEAQVPCLSQVIS